jgi:hypothetical protein
MAKTHLSLPAESGTAAGAGENDQANGYLEGPFAPVARIHIPHRHNAGFHGNWIPDSEIEAATGPL